MANLGKIEVGLDEESIASMQRLTDALNEYNEGADRRLLGILRDVWFQYAINRRNGGWWAGGLSVLEDIEHELRAAGMINANGLETDDSRTMPVQE